jgi:hypothetical protein
MSEETIGKSVTSSTDCEAVYTRGIQGWQRLWKVKFNCAHLHFADRAHTNLNQWWARYENNQILNG